MIDDQIIPNQVLTPMFMFIIYIIIFAIYIIISITTTNMIIISITTTNMIIISITTNMIRPVLI